MAISFYDFLRDGARRQRAGIRFVGIVFAQMERSLISIYIHDLEIIAKVATPPEMENQVIYLPL